MLLFPSEKMEWIQQLGEIIPSLPQKPWMEIQAFFYRIYLGKWQAMMINISLGNQSSTLETCPGPIHPFHPVPEIGDPDSSDPQLLSWYIRSKDIIRESFRNWFPWQGFRIGTKGHAVTSCIATDEGIQVTSEHLITLPNSGPSRWTQNKWTFWSLWVVFCNLTLLWQSIPSLYQQSLPL